MSEERARILDILAGGKITPEEAGRLIDALDDASPTGPAPSEAATGPRSNPRFLYVKVTSEAGDNVNVKVPLGLVRSGLRLTSLIPPQAMEQMNRSMGEHGITLDLSSLKSDDIEDLIQSLGEMEVNVDSKNGDNVKVYCA